ncbi:MAG TPA: glycerophosphodiester phosphodiesterase [Gemmatimonadales bacterium]
MSSPRALIIGHRGASAYEYENSRAAFRAARARGADAVELDIHASADGVLFVHHDEVVSGVHITRAGSAQVRALRLPNGESVPTLEDALAAIDPALRVFVEVKSLPPTFDDRLLALLDASGGRCAVHGFDHRIVRRLGLARPDLPRGVLLASYPLRPLEPLQDTGASVLWEDQGLIDGALVETLHGAGYQIYAWTVNAPDDVRRLVALGVDGLCTNAPDVARQARDVA